MKRIVFVSRHRLSECPACHAHVRVQDEVLATTCDFCRAALAAPTRDVFARLRELGGTTGGVVAALMGLGLASCSDAPIINLGRPDTGDHMVVPLYGIPPVDAGLADAAIVDAREPPPAPEYGGPAVPDAGEPPPGPLYGLPAIDSGTQVVDAAEPPPEPDYGLPPIHPDAAVVDATEPPPEPLYGIAPVDAGRAGADASTSDADEPPPVALYGIAPMPDAGAVQDAADGPVQPLYGGAAVATPSDEILS